MWDGPENALEVATAKFCKTTNKVTKVGIKVDIITLRKKKSKFDQNGIKKSFKIIF